MVVIFSFVGAVYKWRMYLLTKLKPYAWEAAAIAYICTLRFLDLFVHIDDLNEWVFGFWPIFVGSVVVLYASVRKQYVSRGVHHMDADGIDTDKEKP